MLKEPQTPFKRIAAILLLMLFSYNAIFSHVSLWLWKAYMNEQIEELAQYLPNEALEKIILPYSGNTEHEIVYDGLMYDVIRFEQQGTTITYFCIKDFTENILSANTDNTITTKSFTAKKQWASHAKQLQKNASVKYTIAPNYFSLLSPTPNVHIYAISRLSTLAASVAIHTPPPDQQMI